MNIRYRVTLTAEERQQLQALVSRGKGAVRKIKRAQILLAADAKSKSTDETIARTLGSSTSTQALSATARVARCSSRTGWDDEKDELKKR